MTDTQTTVPTPIKDGQSYVFGQLVKGVKTVEVNQMTEIVGSGLSPEDPKRTLVSFWTKDGQCIQSIDPFLHSKEVEKQQKAAAATQAQPIV